MKQFIRSFVAINALMLIGTVALYAKTQSYLLSKKAAGKFKSILMIFAIYLITDMLWAEIAYGILKNLKPVLQVLTFIEFIVLVLGPYEWLQYIREILKTRHSNIQVLHNICKILLYSYFTLVLINLKTGTLYHFTGNNTMVWGQYSRVILCTLVMVCFGCSIIYGIIIFFKSQSSVIKQKALMVILSIVPIMCTIYLYIKYHLAIVLAPSIFIALLLYFLTLEDRTNYRDPLTGLFNRNQLLRILESQKDCDPENKIGTLFIIDVDKFKSINDTYGHDEGDRALQTVGKALKRLTKTYQSMAIRIGGDEFLLIIHDSIDKNNNFKEIIRDSINESVAKEDLPFKIPVSIGKASYDANLSFENCFKDADNAMYKDKESRKQLLNSTP